MNALRALVLLLVLALHAEAGDPDSRFHAATRAYEAGRFEHAAQVWDSLAQAGYGGFELYYNAGNAHFRSGNLGRALLNWERARLIEPADRNLQANLELGRSRLSDRLEEPLRLPLWDLVDRLMSVLPGDLPAWLLLLTLLPLSILVASRLYRRQLGARLRNGSLPLLFLLPVLAAMLILVLEDRRQFSENRAVILEPMVECLAAPSSGSNALFNLHEGTLVRIARSSEDPSGAEWLELELPDGRRGWCRSGQAEALKPERIRTGGT